MALIAVDMTPVLPGGMNGGAKILAIELLKSFHETALQERFLLLTASWNHEDLAFLDSSNMRRICVLKGHEPTPKASHVRYPGRLYRAMGKIRNHLKRTIQKRPPMKKSLAAQNVNLLFCPFTAPTYTEVDIPTVSVIHDLQHRELPHFFSPHEIGLRDNFIADLKRKADRIICVSEHVRKTVLKHLETSPAITHTVPTSIQTRLSRPEMKKQTACLRTLGIHQRPYMFYPANFWPHKNHAMLLTAYGMFLSRHPDSPIDLVFTGALDGREEMIKHAVIKMGLEKRVHFLGFVPHHELEAVWYGCEFLIFPSLYEGFGIPVLEAMSIGKPVLCSNLTALPEVAGDAAVYFDPRKPEEMVYCIEEIARNAPLKKALVDKGRIRANGYRLSDMTLGYLEIFRMAMAGLRMTTSKISGIFEDGWMGERTDIFYAPGPPERVLEIKLEAPPWLPARQIKIRLNDGKKTLQKIGLRRGRESIIRQVLPGKQGHVSLSMNPTFCPSDHGIGEDFRALSVICCGCWMITPPKKKISLF
ncbi:glycosyltransferase, group 1 family protein [delta proteobacterium NaphS2]|nr:glycosyltransferase, group 1 family protein [delta proteobacterium NaphS2]